MYPACQALPVTQAFSFIKPADRSENITWGGGVFLNFRQQNLGTLSPSRDWELLAESGPPPRELVESACPTSDDWQNVATPYICT